MQCDFLTEIFYNKKIPPVAPQPAAIDPEALAEALIERPQGTLIIAADIAAAGRLMRRFGVCPPDLYLGEFPRDPRAFNALCVCPAAGRLPRGYDLVALCGAPALCLPEGAPEDVRALAEGAAPAGWLPDLDGLRAAYTALMRLMRRPVWCASLWQLACAVAEEADMGPPAAAAAILAMADMGLFELALEKQPVTVRRSGLGKAEPEGSAVWRAICRWREGARDAAPRQ